MITVERAADVFVDGFAHLQTSGRPIEVLRSGPVRLVRWGPDGRRGTGFTEEFFPVDLSAKETLAHVRAASPGLRHYVTAIGGHLDDAHATLAGGGYVVNSREALMALDLAGPRGASAAALRGQPDDHPVVVVSAADAERSHALQLAQLGHVRRIDAAELADPTVTVLQVQVDGEPACVGKLVLVGGDAYVSDIATLPAYRRRGLARSLMLGLHAAARDAGAAYAVLTSSDMGRPLYLALGYELLREIVLWEPAATAPVAAST